MVAVALKIRSQCGFVFAVAMVYLGKGVSAPFLGCAGDFECARLVGGYGCEYRGHDGVGIEARCKLAHGVEFEYGGAGSVTAFVLYVFVCEKVFGYEDEDGIAVVGVAILRLFEFIAGDFRESGVPLFFECVIPGFYLCMGWGDEDDAEKYGD